jgi:beta-lactamase regulating signal transducer with metallopeptidase domain
MNAMLLFALKVTIVFGVAGLASLVLRRGRAAARHYVWGLALLGALVLPVMTAVIPRVEVPVLPADDTARPVAPLAVPDVVPWAVSVTTAAATVDGQVTPGPITVGADVPWLPIVWGGGAALVLALIGMSLLATHRLARRAIPVLAGSLADELAAARALLGIRRPIGLFLGRREAMPMTWGARHPVVLLPAAAVAWTPERRRDVLLHELAHVRRLDWLSQLGARIACAAYWWHPLAWYAARRLREERELACDDLVLAHGASAEDYALHLLTIARGTRVAPRTALAGVAMARPSQLAGRLLAVLDGSRPRAGLTRRLAGTAAGGALALLLPVATFTAVAASPEREPEGPSGAVASAVIDGAEPALAASPAQTTPAGLVGLAAAGLPTLCTWDNLGEANASHSNIDDDRVTITIVVDRCELSVRSRGLVRFSDDERDVSDLGMDSWFEIEERARDGGRRRAEFERRNGAVERRWYVDGREQPWDAAAAEWFQGALQVAFRRTSFQARERAARIYQRGGGSALLAEIERLYSSGAIMAYLELYAGQETLTSDEARRIARLAGARVTSSSNLSRVLTTLVRKPGIDDVARADIIEASRRISSSSARAEVLVSASEYAPLTPVLADAVLTSAADISSSSERGRVLTYVGTRLPADQSLPGSYVAAARGISSSSVLGEVLVSLLERDRLSSSQVVGVLDLATGINSSSVRSRVLQAILGRHRLDDPTRGPFFEALRGISSSSEQAATLRAVLSAQPDEATVRLALDAVEGVSSSSEKSSVLAIVVATNPGAAITLRVLGVTRSVASSSERAEVLVAVAQAGLLTTDALRSEYVRVANAISSRSERERALRAAGAL